MILTVLCEGYVPTAAPNTSHKTQLRLILLYLYSLVECDAVCLNFCRQKLVSVC